MYLKEKFLIVFDSKVIKFYIYIYIYIYMVFQMNGNNFTI